MNTGGAIRVSKKKGDAVVKSLTRNQQRSRVDADLPEIPNASKVIEKLEKRIKKVEDELKMREAQLNKLWEWYMRSGGDE